MTGAQRQAEREAEKAKATQHFADAAKSAYVQTRQLRRALDRRMLKRLKSLER